MDSKILSKNRLIKDKKYVTPILIGMLFVTIATAAILTVCFYASKLQEYGGMAIVIPLYIFPSIFAIIGIVLLSTTIREFVAIQNGNFYIFEDVLIERPSVVKYYNSSKGHSRKVQEESLKFDLYYKIKQKHIGTSDHNKNVQVGDICYLIKIKNNQHVLDVYPKDTYQLDEFLMRRLTSATIAFNEEL